MSLKNQCSLCIKRFTLENSPSGDKSSLDDLHKLPPKSILKSSGPLSGKCGRYIGGEIVTKHDEKTYCACCWNTINI